MRTVAILAATAIVLGACTAAGSAPETVADRSVPDSSPTTTTTTRPTTTTTTRECPITPTADLRMRVSDPSELSIALSTGAFPVCADEVVVTSSAPEAITTGSALAADNRSPLLVAGDDLDPVRQEIERLRPLRVVMIDTQLERFPETEMVTRTVDAAAEAPAASGTAVILVDRGNRALVPVAAAYATLLGASVFETPRDVRRVGAEVRESIQNAPSVALIGGFGDAAGWQLEVVRRGVELPGGGQILFPGRRLVALYGSPYSPALGVLGEQQPDASVDIVTALAAEYAALDGTLTVPAFDLIATVASAGAGTDGDYSAELTVDDIRPWIDAAGAAGVYVVLDLQPGRADFLTQAKRYEELLLLPHVGLALDPEWRLGPDQFHLRQVGSVSAAEVNTVSEWLAALVRDNALPQKLLVIHQFRLSMISERQDLRTPSELAVVVQMDGQGPLGSKYGTFDAMTAGAEDVGWHWGWKNFYDEDTPTATPEQTIAVEPQPVFISYQ